MHERIHVALPIVGGVLLLAACGGKLDVGGSGGSAGTSSNSAGAGGISGGPNAPGSAGRGGSPAAAGAGGTGTGGASGAVAGQGGANAGSGGNAGTVSAMGGSAGSGSALGGSGGDVSSNGGEGASDASAGDASGGEGPQPGSCDCATGEALTLIDCGGGRVFEWITMYLSDDGAKLVYAPADESHQVGHELGTWTPSTGAVISSGFPLALSGDGRVLLYGVGSDYLVRIDDEIIPVGAELRQLSQDGKVAAGVGEIAGARQVVIWTREGGLVGTGIQGQTTSVEAISADGSTIGGWVMDGSGTSAEVWRAFLWNESSGAVFLGEPAADGSPAKDLVSAISPNGLYAAGIVRSAELEYRLFRYSSSGLVDLGPCYSPSSDCGFGTNGTGPSFSDDGSVLAGTYGNQHDPGTGHAFVYTEAAGVTPLALGELTMVRGISADGSLVLGVILNGDSGTPFLWDQERGLRRLPEILSAAEVDTRGWTFKNASKISKDGRVVIGEGTCGGASALYRVVLDE